MRRNELGDVATQSRPCPHHSASTASTHSGQKRGMVMGPTMAPRRCEGVGQAFGAAGGSRPVGAGVRPSGGAGHPYGLLEPTGP